MAIKKLFLYGKLDFGKSASVLDQMLDSRAEERAVDAMQLVAKRL